MAREHIENKLFSPIIGSRSIYDVNFAAVDTVQEAKFQFGVNRLDISIAEKLSIAFDLLRLKCLELNCLRVAKFYCVLTVKEFGNDIVGIPGIRAILAAFQPYLLALI